VIYRTNNISKIKKTKKRRFNSQINRMNRNKRLIKINRIVNNKIKKNQGRRKKICRMMNKKSNQKKYKQN
jgi:hypothetical protein